MTNLRLILISIFALTLAACGGDSSKKQDSPKTDDKKDTVTNTCVLKANTITLSGIKYNTADYDKDGDGCLSAKEFNDLKEKAKADAAKLQADIEARTVESTDIKNVSTEFPQIESFSILGSDKADAQSGAKYAVLDANKNGGEFLVVFKFNRNLNLDASAGKQETLRIGIGPDASAELSAGTKPFPDHLNLTSVIKERSGEELRLACTYSGSTKKYTCPSIKTNTNLAAKITIPSDANLFLLMCQGPNDKITCTNHANIKLKLK